VPSLAVTYYFFAETYVQVTIWSLMLMKKIVSYSKKNTLLGFNYNFNNSGILPEDCVTAFECFSPRAVMRLLALI
jgi:hypothetical protein